MTSRCSKWGLVNRLVDPTSARCLAGGVLMAVNPYVTTFTPWETEKEFHLHMRISLAMTSILLFACAAACMLGGAADSKQLRVPGPLPGPFRRVRVRRRKEKCLVCMEQLPRKAILWELPCTHRFCPDCIERWAAAQPQVGFFPCPLCRRLIEFPH